MALTPAQVRIARDSLTDVFTPDGYAVTIARLYTFSDPHSHFYGKGQCAQVNGREHADVWFPVSELEPGADLLRIEASEQKGTRD